MLYPSESFKIYLELFEPTEDGCLVQSAQRVVNSDLLARTFHPIRAQCRTLQASQHEGNERQQCQANDRYYGHDNARAFRATALTAAFATLRVPHRAGLVKNGSTTIVAWLPLESTLSWTCLPASA